MANKLQFEIIENKSVDTLLLNNHTVPETPLQYPVWRIKRPSATDYISIVLTENPAQNITADELGIVCEACYENPLPDGLYEVILQETVGGTVNSVSKYHLRTNLFNRQYAQLLLKMEYSEYTKSENVTLQNLCIDVDMLLASAKAHAEEGNTQTAVELFAKATKIITRITNNLKNC